MRNISRILCLVLATVFVLAAFSCVTNAAGGSGARKTYAMPTFTEVSTGTASGQYSTVAMGDINKDGYAEILSGANKRTGPTTGLYIWQYSGSSWAKQTVSSTGSYGGVALADVTGDGVLDIIAAGETGWSGDSNAKGLILYKCTYSGATISFSSLTSPYSSKSTDCVAAGDLDGDSDKDIAMGTAGGGIQVFINGGGAPPSWGTPIAITATGETTGIALGDLNADGRLDIVATNYNNPQPARVFLCSASSTVSYGSAHTASLPAGEHFGIGIADFNKDSKADIAIGTRSGGVKVVVGNGCSGADTTWWTAKTVPSLGSGDKAQLAVGDINMDGNMDIAVAIDGGGAGVLENDGTATFTKATVTGLPTSGSFYGCCLADFDGDGDLDMALCGWGSGVHFYGNDKLVAPEFGFAGLGIMICGVAAVAAISIRRKVE